MTKVKEIYKCAVCGNIVEIVHAGAMGLVCCGQPMELQKENTIEASKEKHIPVLEKIENGYRVSIGSAPHPMEEEHYIEWIELIADGRVYRQELKLEDKPEAEFCLTAENVSARAYCNLHGLWQA